MRYTLGIDPGLSGALALVDMTIDCADRPKDILIFDMPTHDIKSNGSKKRTLDLQSLGRWFDLYRPQIRTAIIEQPSAMPGQGVTSSFNFGFACGVAQAMVAANIIPVVLVRPAVWKRAMGLTSVKDDSRRKASMLFPEFSHLWPLKKHDGRAEAVLLAVYGSQQQWQ